MNRVTHRRPVRHYRHDQHSPQVGTPDPYRRDAGDRITAVHTLIQAVRDRRWPADGETFDQLQRMLADATRQERAAESIEVENIGGLDSVPCSGGDCEDYRQVRSR
jgi:hypothetical protein